MLVGAAPYPNPAIVLCLVGESVNRSGGDYPLALLFSYGADEVEVSVIVEHREVERFGCRRNE